MNKKSFKLLKLVVIIAIGCLFAWFLVLSPMIQFHNNEKKLEEAAKRYYELHASELPTGERVKTLSLTKLYNMGILKGTYYIPLSKKTCSVEKSWTKVKKENGHYIYYVYLDCGRYKSNVDHTGPKIKLKGKEKITIRINQEYKDPGIESVIDDVDGKIDPSLVIVKNNIDNSKIGTYTVKYKATDSLRNETTIERKVEVVKYLKDYIKEDLGDETIYKGEPQKNYVRFSNMYFRIMGFTKENDIILVAEEDVANVNYNRLDKWLDEVYMKSITKEAKKLLVKHKFCKMKIENDQVPTITKCSSYTKNRYVYVPSITDINKAQLPPTDFLLTNNFLKTHTMSWTSDYQSSKIAYVNKEFFVPENGHTIIYYPDKNSHNFGVRPMLVIKGNVRTTGGEGTRTNPYSVGNSTRAKGGAKLHDRYIGEFININGFRWIIVDNKIGDGTTKITNFDSIFEIGNFLETKSSPEKSGVYNPKDKTNMGYFVNNKASKYIDTDLIIAHEINVPIYKGIASYGDEIKTVKYKVKLAPPNTYDMFSAKPLNRGLLRSYSYWLLNTSNSKNRYLGAISDTGCYLNGSMPDDAKLGIRAVGYIKKDAVITSGEGTYENPYKIK